MVWLLNTRYQSLDHIFLDGPYPPGLGKKHRLLGVFGAELTSDKSLMQEAESRACVQNMSRVGQKLHQFKDNL